MSEDLPAAPISEAVPPSAPPGAESSTPVRLDVWLWSARIYKTRSLAQTACKKGKVSVNDKRANPSTAVRLDCRIDIRDSERPRALVVKRLLCKRVGYPIAKTAYVDNSPAPRPHIWFALPQREPGSGRPTKKERRELTRLRGY